MRTTPIYFEEIVKRVEQETGINNLRNRFDDIYDFIRQAEIEINPYSLHFVRKRMVFFEGNGNLSNNRIKKPKDFISLDRIGCCSDGLCEDMYYETLTHIIICDDTPWTEVKFTYWAMNCDHNGRPLTTMNHASAVVAYIVWKLYSPRVFTNNGSIRNQDYYKNVFETFAREASGEDFFPSDQALRRLSKQYNYSRRQMYDLENCIDTCLSCDCLVNFDDSSPENQTAEIYWWQFDSLANNISYAPLIDQEFLDAQNTLTFAEFEAGYTFNHTKIGRIGFCLTNVDDDSYRIKDYFNVDITDLVFDKYYNADKRWLIWISKEYYSISEFFQTLIPN